MTHLSNYGNDRLALYMLESVTSFLKCWTNLRLLSLPPLEMGFKYFEMYPQDKDPLWTVSGGLMTRLLNLLYCCVMSC